MSESYYQRNREAVLARRKARRAADPERYRVAGRLQMARWRENNPRRSPHHGLSPAEISARLEAQGGCGVCRTTSSAKWHGDHDHKSGLFRAVLCGKCNLGLGLFSDDARRLRDAANYLEHHERLQSLL